MRLVIALARTAARIAMTFWWSNIVVCRHESVFPKTFVRGSSHGDAPAAKPTEPDHAKRSTLFIISGSVGSCA